MPGHPSPPASLAPVLSAVDQIALSIAVCAALLPTQAMLLYLALRDYHRSHEAVP